MEAVREVGKFLEKKNKGLRQKHCPCARIVSQIHK